MKKAQAAMEFLMTYGWAILVVLVAIAALAYFGVLRPGQYLPSSCMIGSGFSCDDFKVASNGTATVVVRNGLGSTITNVTMTIENQCTPANVQLADGATQTFTCTGTAGTSGSKYKHDITFVYSLENGLSHTLKGSLTTKYE